MNMKKVSALFGILIILYMIATMFINFHIGTLAGLFLGAALLAIGTVWDKLPNVKPIKWFKRLIYLGIAFLIIMPMFIFAASLTHKANFEEDVVIILGCAVIGETPSKSLYKRQKKALEYAKINPDAIIVASGGQGPNEKISEAEAIYRFLVENGITEERIIKEDKSTNTSENIVYSKVILDEYFDREYTACIVTNYFHAYRGRSLAKINGINANSYNAFTEIFSMVPMYFRESFALFKLWIFKT